MEEARFESAKDGFGCVYLTPTSCCRCGYKEEECTCIGGFAKPKSNPQQTQTSTDLGPFTRGGFPFCLKCEKLVDEVTTDTPVVTVHGCRGSVSMYTGEVVITVKCHGEAWKMSNWHGRL